MTYLEGQLRGELIEPGSGHWLRPRVEVDMSAVQNVEERAKEHIMRGWAAPWLRGRAGQRPDNRASKNP